MSFGYTVAKINDSLEQLAKWYKEFMYKTEQAFRALHQRITFLEDRQAWQGPSDEQVERVLRKILAERFADAGVQRVENPNDMRDGMYFVANPKEEKYIPKAIPIEIAALHVDPNGVPSKAYKETFAMLESKLPAFPIVDLDGTSQDDSMDDTKITPNAYTHARASSNNRKPWS